MKSAKPLSKKFIYIFIAVCIAIAVLYIGFFYTKGNYAGVDKTVVEKIAKDAGRSPRAPYINTDQGDLLIFLFLIAGLAGGFIIGYNWRGFFDKGNNE